MSPWESRLAEALAQARAQAAALAPHPRLPALIHPLGAIAAALSRGGARAHAGPIAAAILTAAQEAALLTADGHAPMPLLAAVAELAAAFRDHPERGRTLPPRPVDAPSPLQASSGRPRLHAPERAPFVAEESAAALELALVEDEAPEEDDDTPEGDEAPASSARRSRAAAPAEPVWTPSLPAPVRLAEGAGAPITLSAFHADVVGLAAETVAMLARDRLTGPLGRKEDVEARLLTRADAVACIGGEVIEQLLSWWRGALDNPSPWSSWSAVFLLGVLQGSDALDAVLDGLERVPAASAAHAALAAEALAVSPHPDVAALARLLVASPHPIARAAGLGALSRLSLLSADELRSHLIDPSLPVLAAATAAAGRLAAADAQALIPILQRWMGFPHASVAWPAARALTLWGKRDPLYDLRREGPVSRALGGLDQLELLVLSGDAADLPRVDRLVARLPASPPLLSALARLGDPRVWAFLAHHLADEELAEPARAALCTLFGPLVDDDEAGAPAWRRAIQAADLDPALRYRRGEPFRPSVLARECRSGELSRAEVEGRLDELAARAGLQAPVDLARFVPDHAPALEALLAQADRADAAFGRGAR